VLRTIEPSSVKSVALSGTYLVVLTKTRSLDLYGAHSGALQKTLPVRGNPRRAVGSLAVYHHLAVYTVGGELRALDLRTTKDRRLATMSNGIAAARIDSFGVIYAGNRPNGGAGAGTLVYLPLARVSAALR
jgi:hypothetical protein